MHVQNRRHHHQQLHLGLISRHPLLLSDATNYYIYGPANLPVEEITPTGDYCYHHDQLGSTRLLTDSSGNIANTYTYDPYGNTTASTGTVNNPLRYAAAYTDPESGLLYLVNRYYDPATGQFISVDPAFAVTGSRYGYVGDSPLNGTDPTGLFCGGPFFCPVVHLAEHLRLPDYVNLNLGGVFPLLGPFGPGGGFNITLTRNGHVYYGPEGGAGVEGVSGSLEAGWIDQGSTPSACQLDQFVHGASLTANGYVPAFGGAALGGIGPAGGETWGNEGGTKANDFGVNVGVGFGMGHQIGIIQGYNFRARFDLPGW